MSYYCLLCVPDPLLLTPHYLFPYYLLPTQHYALLTTYYLLFTAGEARGRLEADDFDRQVQ